MVELDSLRALPSPRHGSAELETLPAADATVRCACCHEPPPVDVTKDGGGGAVPRAAAAATASPRDVPRAEETRERNDERARSLDRPSASTAATIGAALLPTLVVGGFVVGAFAAAAAGRAGPAARAAAVGLSRCGGFVPATGGDDGGDGDAALLSCFGGGDASRLGAALALFVCVGILDLALSSARALVAASAAALRRPPRVAPSIAEVGASDPMTTKGNDDRRTSRDRKNPCRARGLSCVSPSC